jgi:type VI secretion system secreted protein VgrG
MATLDTIESALDSVTGLDGPATIDTPLGASVRFHSMGGLEELSQPFAFQVDVTSDRADIAASELLGASVTVQLAASDGSGDVRYWNGRVTELTYVDTSDDGSSRYRITLRPWVWQLSQCADCRIFQQLSIPEIVTQVFQGRGFTDFDRSLFEQYEAQEYVVQYRETDLEFVTRLLEREGIYYFFRHEDGKHTLVLADSPQAHSSSPGCDSLPFAAEDEHRDAGMQYVRRWTAEGALRTGRYSQADYDFTKPQVGLVSRATATDDDATAAGALEVYDYPGGFDNFADADAYTRLRLDQARREIEVRFGETNARGLAVGGLFTLTFHPRDSENKQYLVTSARVRVKGQDQATGADDEDPFTNAFAAIDAEATFRPSWTVRKPVMRGPQTAVVVGPDGQEIWTDQYGRVKVQFPWDRLGKDDENSSCWIRVAQSWAGGGFGAQFVPRIGHEVIVDFLEGDPDKPIITGSVYNGSNAPAFDVPGNQTQSGWKTRSTPGGSIDASNEIRFEDAIGAEELYVQAEKDMNVLVKNDQTINVASNRTASIGADDQTTVGGNRSESVAVAETIQIGAAQTLTVGATQGVTVGAAQSITVGAVQTVTVGADRTLTVGGKETVLVSGDQSVTVGGDVSQTVTGDVEAETKGTTDQTFDDDYTERHLGHRTIIVGSGSAARSAVLHVEGKGRAYASKTLEVEVLTGFTLICGKSQIAVTPAGITLTSPNITLASKEVDIVADALDATITNALTLGAATLTLETSGAKVALDSSSASVTASSVKLGSGSGASSQVQSQPVKVTQVQMKDSKGNPRANARVLLIKGDEQRMTVLDANGMLELIGDDSYQVSFPDDGKASK